MNNMYEYEENLYKEGYNFIAGTDEAGRSVGGDTESEASG